MRAGPLRLLAAALLAGAVPIAALADPMESTFFAATVAAKVGINQLAPAELEKLKATPHPMAREDVDAIEKGGKPAAPPPSGYTR